MAPKNGSHYTAIDPPPKVVRTFGPGLTRQSEKDACDVNRIVAKFQKTGLLPTVNRDALFADVASMPDYRTALHTVELANNAFLEMPAKLRAEFDNDPAMFLDFVSDPMNLDQLKDLGLIEADSVAGEVPADPPPESPPPAPAGGE